MRLQLSSIKQDIKEIAEMYQCHFSEYFFFVLEIYFFPQSVLPLSAWNMFIIILNEGMHTYFIISQF